jgi:hypothetical protein
VPLPGPRHDLRPGATSASVFRLCVVALLCALQYWLLTSALETLQAGDHATALPAFLASLTCLALSAGLVVAGESGARKTERTLVEPGARHGRAP